MFRSKTGDEDTKDPVEVRVEELEDPETGERWLTVRWSGPTYEDAWINARKQDTKTLEDNE